MPSVQAPDPFPYGLQKTQKEPACGNRHNRYGPSLYLWKQAPDKSWGRAPVDAQSKELLGVLQGKDWFEFRYQATLPVLPGEARMWLPLAQSDDFQKVETVSVTSPVPWRVLTESAYGNKAIFMIIVLVIVIYVALKVFNIV